MTRKPRTASSFLLAALAFAACDSGTDTPNATATFDTLPNGAVLVHNTAEGAWDSASAWRFVEETRIGSMEGDGPEVFGEVRDLAVDAHGRVWVLDPQSKAIRVFGSDGRFVRTIGRPGAGPGELEHPIGIEFDPQGRAWVHDPGNGRFSVFDSAGAYVTAYRRDSSWTPWTWRGGITADGSVFDLGDVYDDEHPRGRPVLFRYDTAGSGRDTIDLPEFAEEVFELHSPQGTLMQTATVPYSPRLSWELASDGTLWFGTAAEYRLVQTSLDGDTLRVVEKEWTPLPVTAEERDEWLGQEYLQRMKRLGADIDPARVPQTKPAWSSLRFDDRGYLWVVPTRQDSDVFVSDVFDPDGRYLGSVSFGELRIGALPVIRGDRLYAVVYDDLDVPYVVIGRLEGRPAE